MLKPGQTDKRFKRSISDESTLFQWLSFVFSFPEFYKGYDSFKKSDFSTEQRDIFFGIFKNGSQLTRKIYRRSLDQEKNRLFYVAKEILGFKSTSDYLLDFFKKSKQYVKVTEIQNKIDREIVDWMSTYIKKIETEDKVRRIIKEQKIFPDNEPFTFMNNIERSANETYVLTTKRGRKRFYVKTCSSLSGILRIQTDEEGLHPNELLIYKILEYVSFGPRTYFLLTSRTNELLDGCKESYIMTEDVAAQGGIFITESYLNEESKITELIPTKQFAIALSSASLINDLLSLRDTFGGNSNNFGILFNEAKDHASVQFVDHLPCKSNPFFSIIKLYDEDLLSYSPRKRMADRTLHISFFVEAAKISKEKIVQNEIRDAVDQRVLGETKSRQHKSLTTALQTAKDDILRLIQKHNFLFMANAEKELNEYCEMIRENISLYRKTDYAKSVCSELRR